MYAMHPGVYAVGRPGIRRAGVWLAATMRCGEGSVLSHRSAAQLWGVVRDRRLMPVEVTTSLSSHRSGALRRHRATLAPDEVTVRHRIPVTSLARTIFDLAPGLPAGPLKTVIREAEYTHRLNPRVLVMLIDGHPGQRGVGSLSSALQQLGVAPRGRTRSPLEVRFVDLIDRHGMPRPELNVLVELDGEMIEADCLFRRERLIVELDGRQAHRTNAAFQGDRARDRRLLALGWRTVRVTNAHLDRPAPLLADLRTLLELGESVPDVA